MGMRGLTKRKGEKKKKEKKENHMVASPTYSAPGMAPADMKALSDFPSPSDHWWATAFLNPKCWVGIPRTG